MVNNDSSADLEQQTIGVAVNDHIYSISAATTRKKFAAGRQGLSRRNPTPTYQDLLIYWV